MKGSVRSGTIDRATTSRCRRLRPLLGALAIAVVAPGCLESTETTDTLAPLPIVTTTSTTLPPTTTGATVAASTTTLPAPTTTLAPQPVGDWDGARFDFGRIVDDGDIDALYRTIELDRYSYEHPTLGLVDAAGFREEPLTYWWLDEPYENNNPSTREFVLAPNAELLVLSEEGEEEACADPPPAQLPRPVWEGVDISFLDTRAARRSIAIITYAETGAVVRIRFTHGCD